MQIELNHKGLQKLAGAIIGVLQLPLLIAGFYLAVAIALETMFGVRMPFVVAGQEGIFLAALLIWAGR